MKTQPQTIPGSDQRAAISQALHLRAEIEAFNRRCPGPHGPEALTPPFTWNQLERQLVDLAGTELKAGMARNLVSATRKLSRFKPPEMVLREVLCLAWTLLDEDFQPDLAPMDETT